MAFTGYEGASQQCANGNFLCFDKSTCIDNSKLCDGYNDCNDYSDEGGCHSSCGGGDFFYCTASGTCVAIGVYGTTSANGAVCDGSNDCGGAAGDRYSDENNCKHLTITLIYKIF